MKVKKRLTLIIPLGKGRSFEIEKSLKELRKKVDVIVETGQNPSANRNRGIKKAKTEFLAFVNGHSIIPNSWPEEIEKFFDNNPLVDIVGGPQLTHRKEPAFARASGYALSSLFGGGDLRHRYSKLNSPKDVDERHLTSANLICRRKVFPKVMFDEKLWPGEDPKFISDAYMFITKEEKV